MGGHSATSHSARFRAADRTSLTLDAYVFIQASRDFILYQF